VPLVIDVILAGCAVASFGTFFDAVASTRVPDRGRHGFACRTLGDRHPGKCADRGARRLQARRPFDAARRSPASPFAAVALSAVNSLTPRFFL
jgi:hypothetical protein